MVELMKNGEGDASGLAASAVRFENLVAQSRVAGVLSRAMSTGRLPHAYLFLGADGVGKEAAAIDLAGALLCLGHNRRQETTPAVVPCKSCPACAQSGNLAHPNLKILFPLPKPKQSADEAAETYTASQERQIEEAVSAKAADYYSPLAVTGGQEILIEHIRALRHEFSLTSFSGSWRIVIVSQADRLRVQAANAFLKLLEEPPSSVLFILTSSRESRLLPTIVSRCQALRFPPIPPSSIAEQLQSRLGVERETAEAAARLSGGSWPTARDWAREDPASQIAKAVNLLRLLVKGDPGDLDSEVDRLTTGGKADEFPALLRLLSRWLREVERYETNRQVYSHLGSDEALVRLAKFCSGRDFARAIESVENAHLDLEKRVQPSLVAHRLFILLRRILFEPESAAASS